MPETKVPLTPAQQAWVDALRSGKYEQTERVLCRLDDAEEPIGFCCLGVACELAREAGVELNVDSTTDDFDEDLIRVYDERTSYLPAAVVEWLGVCDVWGGFAPERTLAERNDSGATFAEIADLIERRADTLFEAAS